MTKLIHVVAVAALASAVGGCFGETGEYLHRSDTIALDNGNAANANIAIHTIDPWPPGVGDRRIPANGERMVGAVNRYQGGQSPGGPGGAPAGVQGSTNAPATPPPVTPSGASAVPPATLPF